MMESDTDHPEHIVKEMRLQKYVQVLDESIRITGKPDYTNIERGVLIDYKSKHNLPTKPDARHEAQFNIYAFLWKNGEMIHENDDGSTRLEKVDITIVGGGMHYITWNTKIGTQFKKMAYPVWTLQDQEQFIIQHATPLVQWKKDGILPTCSPFFKYPGKWRCDCVKLEEQLNDRGIYL